MEIDVRYDEGLSKERGGHVFVVRDPAHPEVEGVLSFVLLAGHQVGLEAIEVALAPLRSSRSSFVRPDRKSRRLTPSEVEGLPLGAWAKAAEPQALARFDEVQENVRTIRKELRKRPPEGRGVRRRFDSRRRLLEVADAVLTGTSVEDIAEKHGVKPETARVLIYRARKEGILPSLAEEVRK